MNRKNEKFDWDNDDLSEIKAVTNQPKLINPGIMAEFPGIETEEMVDDTETGPTSDQEEKPSPATRAKTARVNAGLDDDDQRQARGVNDEKASDDVIVIDDDDGDPNGVKSESSWYIKSENVAPIVKTVDEDDDDEGVYYKSIGNHDEDNDRGEVPRHSTRVKKPRTLFTPRG